MRTCECQREKALPPQPQKKLRPIPPPERPWKHIGMDLICDLPETSDGYKHVLVTVCYLSKYVVARPLRTKTTSEVISQLEDTVCFIIIYNYYTQCNLITQVDIHSFKFYFGSMAP